MSRGQHIFSSICTYNYMQYATGAYRSCTHFPSQHELGPRTPPLDVLTTRSWHGRNTCVWCSAHSSLYRSAAKLAGSGKKTCTMEPLCICDGREAKPMFARLLLPSSVTALVPTFSVAMLLPIAAWRHYHRLGWRRILCSGPAPCVA